MSITTEHSILLAERAAGRAADAVQDAVALIAQGRLEEAAERLDEVAQHARTAGARLGEACT